MINSEGEAAEALGSRTQSPSAPEEEEHEQIREANLPVFCQHRKGVSSDGWEDGPGKPALIDGYVWSRRPAGPQ